MAEPGAQDSNGADPAVASNGAEYANRLEMLDEAVEHVLLQLIESDFILTGPNGGVTRWGDRAKLLFGWDTQRIVGSSLFDTVLGGDAEGPVRRWESFLAEREGDPPPARFAVQARHCDGAEFPLELTFVPVRLSQGSEFSFFVRDLTADLPSGAKLARLRRDHKEVLQSISSALQKGTPLEPEERLAGVLVAYAATGPTPWVDAARREAEEAAAALADVAKAGEKGGDGAAADRMARTLAKAKRAERSADEARAERQALQEQLTTAVERSEQLEREGQAMREALDDARRKASTADENAERAQSEAESAHGDAAQAIRLVRDLERQTQEVRGQLTQARGDSGEGAKRLAALERATEGATERLARLEKRAREEGERLTRVEESGGGDLARLEQLENDAKAMRKALDDARRQAGEAAPAGPAEDPVAREEAQRLGERLEDALAQLAEARTQFSEASPTSSGDRAEGPGRAEVDGAVQRVQQLQAESEELARKLADGQDQAREIAEAKSALESLGGQLDELRAGREELQAQAAQAGDAARAAGGDAAGARSAADEARTEASRSAEEAARARDELAEVRQELAATRAEVAEAKGELAELRQLTADVREAAESARAEAQTAVNATEQARAVAEQARGDAEAAGHSGREAAEQGERALQLVGEASEQAQSAGERSEEIAARLAEVGGDVERAGAESSTAREELASLRTQAEEVLRVLERSVGRVLSGGPPAADGWSEPPTAAPTADEPEPEPEPSRDPREGFDDVTAPMAMLDLEGRFLELNSVFCELVGYTEEEFRTAIWPSSLSDDGTRKEHRELRGRLATGEIEHSPIETCYLHKEGLLVPVSGTVSLVRSEDGAPDHLLLSGAGDRAAVSA